jgi:hypothetical protein
LRRFFETEEKQLPKNTSLSITTQQEKPMHP